MSGFKGIENDDSDSDIHTSEKFINYLIMQNIIIEQCINFIKNTYIHIDLNYLELLEHTNDKLQRRLKSLLHYNKKYKKEKNVRDI
jgi:hypothetical protein